MSLHHADAGEALAALLKPLEILTRADVVAKLLKMRRPEPASLLRGALVSSLAVAPQRHAAVGAERSLAPEKPTGECPAAEPVASSAAGLGGSHTVAPPTQSTSSGSATDSGESGSSDSGGGGEEDEEWEEDEIDGDDDENSSAASMASDPVHDMLVEPSPAEPVGNGGERADFESVNESDHEGWNGDDADDAAEVAEEDEEDDEEEAGEEEGDDTEGSIDSPLGRRTSRLADEQDGCEHDGESEGDGNGGWGDDLNVGGIFEDNYTSRRRAPRAAMDPHLLFDQPLVVQAEGEDAGERAGVAVGGSAGGATSWTRVQDGPYGPPDAFGADSQFPQHAQGRGRASAPFVIQVHGGDDEHNGEEMYEGAQIGEEDGEEEDEDDEEEDEAGNVWTRMLTDLGVPGEFLSSISGQAMGRAKAMEHC